MIEEKPDGTVDVSFEDWTPQMMALSSRLHQLPAPPGGKRNHEIGVDRLSKTRSGATAVKLLFRYAGELEYCPTESEVVRLGLALVRTAADLDRVLQAGPAPGQAYGFVRRNY